MTAARTSSNYYGMNASAGFAISSTAAGQSIYTTDCGVVACTGMEGSR
jgi:hypothetical protein